MICCVCRTGVSFFSKCDIDSAFYVCSWPCANQFMDLKILKNPNDYQQKALAEASEQAGLYIERLREPNIHLWRTEEWDMFIKTVVSAFQNSLSKSYNEDPPF